MYQTYVFWQTPHRILLLQALHMSSEYFTLLWGSNKAFGSHTLKLLTYWGTYELKYKGNYTMFWITFSTPKCPWLHHLLPILSHSPVNAISKNNCFNHKLTTNVKTRLETTAIIKQNSFAEELKALPILIWDLKTEDTSECLNCSKPPCLIPKVAGLLMHQPLQRQQNKLIF